MASPALQPRGGATAGLQFLTSAQAVATLLRTEAVWGTMGQPTSVTYAFEANPHRVFIGGWADASVRLDAAQMKQVEDAFASWAEVATITFTRVGSGYTGDAAYSDNATIKISAYTSSAGYRDASAALPTNSPRARDADWSDGDILFPTGDISWAAAHEIGHAIGLSHPSTMYAPGPDGRIVGAYVEDSQRYSIMSYVYALAGDGRPRAASATPMIDDIAAIQKAYGANMATRSGDTVYGVATNAGDIYADTAMKSYAIWDGGGIDTLDYSSGTRAQSIDLRQGAFSYIGNDWQTAEISIAYGAVIENAKTGSGHDLLIGNAADNQLSGGAGADSLYGGAGNDWLDGGAGADQLEGEEGDDVYVVDSSADAIVELDGQGSDTVLTSAGVYELPLGVSIEKLAAVDPGSNTEQALRGNTGDQLIVGSAGRNTLNGFGGSDTLAGLGGDDTYLVRGLGDRVLENNGEGRDTVFTTVSYNLGANEVEVLSTVTQGETTKIDLIGNYATQLVIGNYGDNILNGGVGGDDTLIGLRGDDLYAVGSASIRVVESAGEGFDTLVTSVDYRLADNVSIEVFAAQNRDVSTGLRLAGNNLAQVIAGTNAADTIDGGGGADTLSGQGGADLFMLSAKPGAGVVTIGDFGDGADRIGLAASSFNVGGMLDDAKFMLGAAATTRDQRVLYDRASGRLMWDADGSGETAAILIAQLGAGTEVARDQIISVTEI